MTSNFNPDEPAPTQPLGYGPPQMLPPRTNILAIVSLVASLSTVITGFGFIVGIITGHYAIRQIEDKGEEGRGYAVAGLVVGYACLALILLTVLALVVSVVFLAAAPSMGT